MSALTDLRDPDVRATRALPRRAGAGDLAVFVALALFLVGAGGIGVTVLLVLVGAVG